MTTLGLHVHTAGLSQRAVTVDPYRIEHIFRASLDGEVLTDHDVLWEEERIRLLRGRSSAILINRGLEGSARGVHLSIIGLDDAEPFHGGIPVAEAYNTAHKCGASVILARPFRDADPTAIPVELLDAIEVESTSFTVEEAGLARKLARRSSKLQVESSDAHAISRTGWGRTEFPDRPPDERALAAWIVAGTGKDVVPGFRPCRLSPPQESTMRLAFLPPSPKEAWMVGDCRRTRRPRQRELLGN